MTSPDEIFRDTLRQLETGFTVSMIATGQAMAFDCDQLLADALATMNERDYSQVVVTSSGAVVGVLEDVCCPDRMDGLRLADRMMPLDGNMLVSAGSGLRALVQMLANDDRRYRLVVGMNGGLGIVTRSDLQKLPVRLLLFTYLTHLESMLAAVIEEEAPDESWTELLARKPAGLSDRAKEALGGSVGSKAVEKLREERDKYERGGDKPYFIELTQFSQKWYVVHQLCDLGEQFVEDMVDLQWYLRNMVMHSRNYVPDDVRLTELEDRVSRTQFWITEFARMLGEGSLWLATNEAPGAFMMENL